MNNNTIKNEVAQDLIDKLSNNEGREVYGADLAFTLFEGYNADGSVTYSRYKAQEWIKAHFACVWVGGCRLSDITQEEFDKVQNLYLGRVKENDKV